MNTDIAYKWIGEEGSFLIGAPARNIYDWEVAQDPEMAANIDRNIDNGGGLYEKVIAKKQANSAKAKESEPEKASDTKHA